MSNNNDINKYDQDFNNNNNIGINEENMKQILSFSNIRDNFNFLNKDNNLSNSNEDKEELNKKKLEEEKEKNAIRDKLKCFICFGKVLNAMMCPYCKKLACEQCIKTVLEKSSICSNCKNIVLINELIKIPLLNDFTSFFINNMEQKDEIDKDDINIMAELKKQKCEEHPNKNIEYFCMNCNQFLCSLSLLFFNKESVDKHKNHIILSLDEIEKFNLYKIIKEYRNLKENKEKMENKKNNYQKSINEINYKKNSIKNTLNLLKTDLKAKYDNKINKIKSILNTLNNKKNNITNKLQKPPNLMLDLNNEEKSKKILEELTNLNNIGLSEIDIEKEVNFKKMIKYEQFESEYIEIKLPNNGEYIEEFKVIDKELNFIPNTKCKLNCQLLMNNIFFSLVIEINKQFIEEHSLKFICILIFETKNIINNILPKGVRTNNEMIFSTQFDFNVVKNIINKDGKYYCKFNIVKFYYK